MIKKMCTIGEPYKNLKIMLQKQKFENGDNNNNNNNNKKWYKYKGKAYI